MSRLLSVQEIAEQFHIAYEKLAPSFGYETREASAKPWADVPEQNKALMAATVRSLINDRIIWPGVIDVLRSHDDVLKEAMNELHPGIDLS